MTEKQEALSHIESAVWAHNHSRSEEEAYEAFKGWLRWVSAARSCGAMEMEIEAAEKAGARAA